MSLHTLLVHAQATDDGRRCLGCAAALSVEHEAHLVGIAAMNAVATAVDWSHELSAAHSDLAQHALRERARATAAWFEHEARTAGVPSFESRIEVRDVGEAMALHARYADLVVMSLPDPQSWDEERSTLTVEHVLQHAARPLLLVPRAGASPPAPGGVALVAWDASREAARAVADALPLLRRSRHVHVLQVLPCDEHTARADGPATAVAWLEHHGVHAQALQLRQRGSVAETLLHHASACQADLLVAGGYGHSPLREAFTRGVTRTLLRRANLSLLLSH